MKKNKIIKMFFCFFISVVSNVALGNPQPAQYNNGPNGVFNNNTGSGSQYNFSIKYLGDYQNNVQSIDTQVNNYNFSPTPAPRENNRDRLSVYQERYLIATNPTELSVSHVELANWIGDIEPFLTVTVENPANIPAQKLRVSLLKHGTGKRPSETIKFLPSNALVQSNTLKTVKAGLFLPQKKSIRLPIGSKTQLIENVVEHIPQRYTLLGIGEEPNIPTVLCDNTYSSSTKNVDYNMHKMEAMTVSFAIALKYDTIFDQHLVRLFPLYLYFGRCHSQEKEWSNK